MKIFVITGQTATGKTSYAMKLADKHNGELINCDSRQIYKQLDIITGKDLTDKTFHSVYKINNFEIGYYKLPTHIWLYDIVNPKEYFSSFDYQECAIRVIKDILSRGKTPIIVGGTYFYLKHLLYDIGTQNIKPDWNLRKEMENKTVKELQNILKNKSEKLFNSLNDSDVNNPQRLIRKIEIAGHSNEEITTSSDITLPNKLGLPNNLNIEIVGLKYSSKDEIHTKIDRRVEERIQSGAIQEVEQLLHKGYTEEDPGLRTIGYQQIIKYLQNHYSKEDAIQEWKTKEKQYAKRQDTFMKMDKHIQWQIL